jgi:molybdopterin-guanine dinucleotide biosynthesis protein A
MSLALCAFSPNDPLRFSMFCALGLAHFIAGRYTQALAVAEAAARDRPEYVHPICIVAASAALSGGLDEANKAMVILRQLDPTLRISNLRRLQSIKRPEDLAKWEEGLRLAGLPE